MYVCSSSRVKKDDGGSCNYVDVREPVAYDDKSHYKELVEWIIGRLFNLKWNGGLVRVATATVTAICEGYSPLHHFIEIWQVNMFV